MKSSTHKMRIIPSSEITPEEVYLNRRQFLEAMGIVGAGALLAACGVRTTPSPTSPVPGQAGEQPVASRLADELGDPANAYDEITNYNNYYEFTTLKQGVAPASAGFKTSPWTVEVGGLVNKPGTFDVDDFNKMFPQEERIYRLRCVEAWSMVIPWLGFPLSLLVDHVQPMASAKYIGFVTVTSPEEMPGQKEIFYPWPYTEGLRLDEAQHDLTIMATGLYGKPLPPQNGAPLRLVVPWKYGFKSIKAIVKIDFLELEPTTFWSAIAPDEYGFYANVNPDVSHPRWSQATERRIGETSRRKTLPFNGYGDEVAGLYTGMDLAQNY